MKKIVFGLCLGVLTLASPLSASNQKMEINDLIVNKKSYPIPKALKKTNVSISTKNSINAQYVDNYLTYKHDSTSPTYYVKEVKVNRNEVYYERTRSNNTDIERSYYKLTKGYWFHYKNYRYYKNTSYNEATVQTTTYHYDSSRCQYSTRRYQNCTAVNGWKSMIATDANHNYKNGKYVSGYYRTYLNRTSISAFQPSKSITYLQGKRIGDNIELQRNGSNQVTYYKAYRYHANNRAKTYVYGRPANYSSSTFYPLNTMRIEYNTRGKILSKTFVTSAGKITHKEVRTYRKNGTIFSNNTLIYYANGQYRGRKLYKFTTFNKLKSYDIFNAQGKKIRAETRAYYKNKRVKGQRIVKADNNGVKIVGTYSLYRKNRKRIHFKKLFFKKGKPILLDYYVFNKRGQLKSNKNGDAFKYVSKIKGRYIDKVYRAKYNKKGKLGKAKKVASTKENRTF